MRLECISFFLAGCPNWYVDQVRHVGDVCGLEAVNKPIPTCNTHFNILNASDLGTFMVMLPGYGHGPMHVGIGGLFGQCTGAMETLYEKHFDELDQVIISIYFY